MVTSRARLLACIAGGILILMAGVDPARAQCNTTGNPNMTTFPTGPTIVITKYLTAATTCTGTVSTALACYPSNGEVVTGLTFLVASALTATVNPVCQWNCGCGTVTTDTGDGLPVELMDFEIEASSQAAGMPVEETPARAAPLASSTRASSADSNAPVYRPEPQPL